MTPKITIENVRTLARSEAFGNPRSVAFHLNTHNPLRAVYSLRPRHTLEAPGTAPYRYATYNFTPALARQMEFIDPHFLRRLKTANDLNVHDQNGHGGAIASGFDHAIFPLAIGTDKEGAVVLGRQIIRTINTGPAKVLVKFSEKRVYNNTKDVTQKCNLGCRKT